LEAQKPGSSKKERKRKSSNAFDYKEVKICNVEILGYFSLNLFERVIEVTVSYTS
jgi:hypothetical protein